MIKEKYTCKQGTRTFDKYDWIKCDECPFLYTHLAECYVDDIVECRSDAVLRKGQKFTVGSRCRPI